MEHMPAAAPRPGRWAFYSSSLPWLVLAIGIPASFFLYALVQDSIEDVARLRFEREAQDASSVIQGRLRSYSDVLYALRALFASESPVDRRRFHRYLDALDLKLRYPGFVSLNYAAYVPQSDKGRFEEAVRNDTSISPQGYPQFAIKPPGERPEYFVMVYLEPMANYEFAFGLDLGMNPAAANPGKVAAAMRLGRDTGKVLSSAQPLRIKVAKETIFLSMRLAVYQNGMPNETVEQRRAAYLGSVGAGFDVEYLMREALNEELLRYIRLRLYDAGPSIGESDTEPPGEKRLLFDSEQLAVGPSKEAAADDFSKAFVLRLPIEIAGRVWEFEYSAKKSAVISDTDRVLPPVILAGGLLLSALLFGVLYSLASSRRRAVEIANEITRDLRESEKELRASTEQLQGMSRRLVDVQESERRQFSRELHDRVGQNLTALSISIDILKSQMSNNGNAALRSRLDDAAALLESTSGTIENVMSELRPPMLDDYGLLPALQWYANEFSGRTGIQVSVEGDEGIERLPQASEISLFRIVQEALNNVAKHARAGRVHIVLERSDSQFVMSVSDDGVGMDAASHSGSSRRPGLGMVTMRERTQAVGGRFEIGAASGRGTRVVVRIPC
jgi:signal transduction histidine kinase